MTNSQLKKTAVKHIKYTALIATRDTHLGLFRGVMRRFKHVADMCYPTVRVNPAAAVPIDSRHTLQSGSSVNWRRFSCLSAAGPLPSITAHLNRNLAKGFMASSILPFPLLAFCSLSMLCLVMDSNIVFSAPSDSWYLLKITNLANGSSLYTSTMSYSMANTLEVIEVLRVHLRKYASTSGARDGSWLSRLTNLGMGRATTSVSAVGAPEFASSG